MSSAEQSSCAVVVALCDEPHHHLVIDNEWVRAYAVEIPPHQSTLCHHHAVDYLMYVAGEAEIVSAPRQGDARKHQYLDTYCEFSSAGLEHVVENLSDSPFRNLVIEVLPALSTLHRSGLPFAGAGGVRSSHLYSGEAICAQLLELNSGSQTQVTGPAIVASAYEDIVEFITPQSGARNLQSFQDLAFLPQGTTALLRCEAGKSVRALIVTLGRE